MPECIIESVRKYLYKLYQIYECLMDKDETAIS